MKYRRNLSKMGAILLLFASCQTGAITTTEKGKCVDIDEKWAYFEIYYNCKRPYPCVKTAYTKNSGKYKVGQTYKITQILR
jgi:hypothetical protein